MSSGNFKIAVISDIHYMAGSLNKVPKKGDLYVSEVFIKDRTHKAMLEFVPLILDSVCDQLSLPINQPDVILVCGDLTKDGEVDSHLAVFNRLKKLQSDIKKSSGKDVKIYVVPGSSDIQSPGAVEYSVDANGNIVKTKVATLDIASFAKQYQLFGYNSTFKHFDPITNSWKSLSYLAHVKGDLWVLAVDPLYSEENLASITSVTAPLSTMDPALRTAKISNGLIKWISNQLQSVPAGATVIGLMHYNLIEHFKGQSESTLKKNVIQLGNIRAYDFMNKGIQLVFTGRHANDIAKFEVEDKMIYDIQTGALVTPPCPYRIIDLSIDPVTKKNDWVIDTRYPDPGPIGKLAFSDFAKLRMQECVSKVLPDIASRDAFMAHVSGGEQAKPEDVLNYLGYMGGKMATFFEIFNLWTDQNVQEDNQTTLSTY